MNSTIANVSPAFATLNADDNPPYAPNGKGFMVLIYNENRSAHSSSPPCRPIAEALSPYYGPSPTPPLLTNHLAIIGAASLSSSPETIYPSAPLTNGDDPLPTIEAGRDPFEAAADAWLQAQANIEHWYRYAEAAETRAEEAEKRLKDLKEDYDWLQGEGEDYIQVAEATNERLIKDNKRLRRERNIWYERAAREVREKLDCQARSAELEGEVERQKVELAEALKEGRKGRKPVEKRLRPARACKKN